MYYINQVIILQCGPASLHYCTLPKKAFPFSLGEKKRIYLKTQLKEEFTLIKKLTNINRCLTDPANRCLTDV